MRITVLGATGMAGAAITGEAVRRGHHVIAVSRHPGQVDAPLVTGRAVDVASTELVSAVLNGVDAAVLAVRPAPGNESLLPALTASVLSAAQHRETPVLVVGGAAPLWSPTRPGLRVIDDTTYVPAAWRAVAEASLDQFYTCQRHSYEGWTYISPPAIFEPGQRTGRYERGTGTLLVDGHGRSRISAADFAIAVLDELENPGDEAHITVASSSSS